MAGAAQLDILIKAQDEASKTLKAVQTEINKITKAQNKSAKATVSGGAKLKAFGDRKSVV